MTAVLHIIATADPKAGGPIEGAIRTGENWARQGHRQDLLTFDPPGSGFHPDYPGRIIELGQPRTRTPWSRYGYAPGAIGWLRAHARGYDAAIVAGLWNYAAMAARFGLAGTELPYFVYPHGMLDPWFRRTYPAKHLAKQAFWLFNEGPLLRHARAVLFTTQEEQQLAARAFRPYRLTGKVVGYGTADVPPPSLGQRHAFAAAVPGLSRPYLLFLSRIHQKKGCDLLIEGFAAAAAHGCDLDLVIAGPDPDGLVPALRERVSRAGMAGRVHFPGMLAGDAKWGAFHGCEAFILPSHQENFGVVVAEAMACAKPSLISNKVNIWREVTADAAGLVESDTVAGVERLVARFLCMGTDARRAMGAAARTAFLARFRIESVADALLRTITA